MEKEKNEIIISCLISAEKEMAHDYAKKRIDIAKKCFEAGIIEDVLNAPILRSLINLLAPFVKNSKVKNAIKLLQDGLEEEKRKEKERGKF